MLWLQFIDRSKQLGHRDERDLRIDVVDGGKLSQPGWVDPDRHRGVRAQGMLVALSVRTAVIERRVCGRKPYLFFDTIVMVMVERRAQEVQRHHH